MLDPTVPANTFPEDKFYTHPTGAVLPKPHAGMVDDIPEPQPEPQSRWSQLADIPRRVVTESVRHGYDLARVMDTYLAYSPAPGMREVMEGTPGAQLITVPASKVGIAGALYDVPEKQVWALPEEQAFKENAAVVTEEHEAIQRTLKDWGIGTGTGPNDVVPSDSLIGKGVNWSLKLAEDTAGMGPALVAAVVAAAGGGVVGTAAGGPVGGVVGAGLGAMAVGGGMEAAAELDRMIASGATKNEATAKMAGITAAVGALNAVPIVGKFGSKFLSKIGSQRLHWLAQKAFTATAEGLTEWAEGPAIQTIGAVAPGADEQRKVDMRKLGYSPITGEDAGDDAMATLQNIIGGGYNEMGVFVPASLSGLLMSMLTGGKMKARAYRGRLISDTTKKSAEWAQANNTVASRDVEKDVDELIELSGNEEITEHDVAAWSNALANGRGDKLKAFFRGRQRIMGTDVAHDVPDPEKQQSFLAGMGLVQNTLANAEDKGAALHEMRTALEEESQKHRADGKSSLVEDTVLAYLESIHGGPIVTQQEAETGRAPAAEKARVDQAAPVSSSNIEVDTMDLLKGPELTRYANERPAIPEQLTTPDARAAYLRTYWKMKDAAAKKKLNVSEDELQAAAMPAEIVEEVEEEENDGLLEEVAQTATDNEEAQAAFEATQPTVVDGEEVRLVAPEEFIAKHGEEEYNRRAALLARPAAQLVEVPSEVPAIENVAIPTQAAEPGPEGIEQEAPAEMQGVVEEVPAEGAAETLTLTGRDGMPERPMMSKEEIWKLYDTDPEQLRTLVHPEIFDVMVDLDTQEPQTTLEAFMQAKGAHRVGPDNLWRRARKRIQEAEHATSDTLTVGDILTVTRDQQEQRSSQEANTLDVSASPVEATQALPAPGVPKQRMAPAPLLAVSQHPVLAKEQKLRNTMSPEQRALRERGDTEIEAASMEEAEELLAQQLAARKPILWKDISAKVGAELGFMVEPGGPTKKYEKVREALREMGVLLYRDGIGRNLRKTGRLQYYIEAVNEGEAVAKAVATIRSAKERVVAPAERIAAPVRKNSVDARDIRGQEEAPTVPLSQFDEARQKELHELNDNPSTPSFMGEDGNIDIARLAKLIVGKKKRMPNGSIEPDGHYEARMQGARRRIREWNSQKSKSSFVAVVRNGANDAARNWLKKKEGQEEMEWNAHNSQPLTLGNTSGESARELYGADAELFGQEEEAVDAAVEAEAAEGRRKVDALPKAKVEVVKNWMSGTEEQQTQARRFSALSQQEPPMADADLTELAELESKIAEEAEQLLDEQTSPPLTAEPVESDAEITERAEQVAEQLPEETPTEVKEEAKQEAKKRIRAQQKKVTETESKQLRILNFALEKVQNALRAAMDSRKVLDGREVLEPLSLALNDLALARKRAEKLGALTPEMEGLVQRAEAELLGAQHAENMLQRRAERTGRPVNTDRDMLMALAEEAGYEIREVTQEELRSLTPDSAIAEHGKTREEADEGLYGGLFDSKNKILYVAQEADLVDAVGKQRKQKWHLGHEFGHASLEGLTNQTEDPWLAEQARQLIAQHGIEGAANVWADAYVEGDLDARRAPSIWAGTMAAIIRKLPTGLMRALAKGRVWLTPRDVVVSMYGDRKLASLVKKGGESARLANLANAMTAQQEAFRQNVVEEDGVRGVKFASLVPKSSHKGLVTDQERTMLEHHKLYASIVQKRSGVRLNEWRSPAEGWLLQAARESGIPITNRTITGEDLYRTVMDHYGSAEGAAGWFASQGIAGQRLHVKEGGKRAAATDIIGSYDALEIPELAQKDTPANWVTRQQKLGRTVEEVEADISGMPHEDKFRDAIRKRKVTLITNNATKLRDAGADGWYAFTRAKEMVEQDWNVTAERLEQAMEGYDFRKVRNAQVIEAELAELETLAHSSHTPKDQLKAIANAREELHQELRNLGGMGPTVKGMGRFNMYVVHTADRWLARALNIRKYGRMIGAPKLADQLWRSGGERELQFGRALKRMRSISDKVHKVTKNFHEAQAFFEHATFRLENDYRYMQGVGANYWATLTPKQQSTMNEVVAEAREYYETMQAEMKERGYGADFVKSRLEKRTKEYNRAYREVEKLGEIVRREEAKNPESKRAIEAKKKLAKAVDAERKYKEEMKVLMGLRYVNVPVSAIDKGKQGARVSTQKERETLSVWSLVSGEQSVLRQRDCNILDIMCAYGEHVAMDIALAECIRAAYGDGVATVAVDKETPPPGYVPFAADHPVFNKVWMKESARDFLYNNTLRGYMNGPIAKQWRSMANYKKAASFYNPAVMPGLNFQQLWQLGIDPASAGTQLVMKKLRKEREEQAPEYQEYLRSGAASNPHGAPLSTHGQLLRLKRGGGYAVNALRSATFAGTRLELESSSGEKWKAVTEVFGDNVVTAYYDWAMDLTWQIDDLQRYLAYKTMRGRGYTQTQAGTAVAEAMGDYGNIPKATRIYSGMLFFTPSYWISTMRYSSKTLINGLSAAKSMATGKGLGAKHKVALTSIGMGILYLCLQEAIMAAMGFGRDTDEDWWDALPFRKYSKRIFSEKLGREKELVAVLNSPTLAPLREFQRMMNVVSGRGGMEGLLHPFITQTFRALVPFAVGGVATNAWGQEIYSEFDNTSTKLGKIAKYLLTGFVPLAETVFSNRPMDTAAQEELEGWKHIYDISLGYFMSLYTREVPERRAYIKAKGIIGRYKSEVFKKIANGEPVPEEWAENVRKALEAEADRQ